MYAHGPSVLQGPITQHRPWWLDEDQPTTSIDDLASDRQARTMDTPLDEPCPSEPPLRTELIERVRREIADGTYETAEKWDIALDRLLDRLEKE